MAENCEMCGFPLDSRAHLEGRGDIHVRPVAQVTVAVDGEVITAETVETPKPKRTRTRKAK